MLKKIELKGFKSFADKTVIDFDRGISCVVGPNGSGKSNITDAFRWVLGEQSYKSLRGKQMTDVIFNGTVSRDALGYAEVVVVLDNSEKIVDLPYEEVSILRRLYRSGESQYSINGTSCRLKDIKELFLDTGVGVEGYSIIGQGRIDKLLSSGKEDRRAIFEEASGIAKYKNRKEEAARKLERTHSHLERIQDLTSELELRVGPLKEQSEKATEYLQVKQELKSVEISVILQEIDRIREDLSSYERDLARLEGESETTTQSLLHSKEGLGTLRTEMDERKLQKQSLAEKKIDLEKDLIQLEGRFKLLEERSEQSSLRRAELDRKLESIRLFLSEAEGEKGSLEEAVGASSSAYEEKKREIERIKEDFDRNNRELNDRTAKLALIKAERRDFFDQLGKLEIERAELRILSEQAEKKVTELELRIRQGQEHRQGALLELEGIQKEINAFEREERDLRERKSDLESQISEARIEIDKLENETYRLQTEKNEAISNKEILEKRIENHEGMTDAARAVLQEAKRDSSVYGTVASLISIDKEYELALEQILGARAENIVTADFDSAKKYIEFLKREQLGRQSFLPLDGIRANEILDLDDFEGLCGHAMDFIDCDEAVEPAIRYLLYNVSFVEDLDAAKRAIVDAPSGYKLVTLQGEVVNVGGTVSGGSHKKRRPTLFSDKRRLKELEAQIEAKTEALAERSRRREARIQDVQALLDRLGALQGELDVLKEKKMSAMALLDAERRSLSGGVEAQKSQEEERDAERERQLSLEERLRENRESELALRDKNERQSVDTDSLKEEIDQLRKKNLALQDQINAKSIEGNKLDFERKNAELQRDTFLQKLQSAEREANECGIERDLVLKQIKDREEERESLQESIRKNSEERVQVSKDLHQVEIELTKLNEKNGAEYARFKELENALNDLKDSMYGIRIQSGKLETRLENQENALWESYRLSYAGALEFKTEISYSSAKTLLHSYKKKLEEIGDVNLLAIEEYREVSDRYAFMSSQKNDLQESLEKLQAIIKDMDEKMRVSFRESLDDINEKFKTTFRDLFRGGIATIELEEGEDVLDAEIIINAQPPGKKLQTLELLSGGEKALTAIAILFAILKTKPAPFCILDEIEAALDDRNIALFSNFLSDYKRDSQFIIISHRKGTIKIADSLYGVTMKEKGISEILSLKLTDGTYEEA